MAPIALDPKSTFTYVLADDRQLPEEDQTRFELRGLTVSEEAAVSDSMILAQSGMDELSFRAGTHQLTVLRKGLRDWANFKDAEGAEIPFKRQKGHPPCVTDECLDRLLPRHRQEIMNAILERGSVSTEEGN
tara:strand:- start:1385 stop:1780 length:396 start_codon:yes stop_codon:yes gene_type:complete